MVVDDLGCSRAVDDDVVLAELIIGMLVSVAVEEGLGVLSSASGVDDGGLVGFIRCVWSI